MSDQEIEEGALEGALDVLNVGAGHLKLSFKSKDPAEVEKARKAVEDMLKRGYAILIEVPDKRAKSGKRMKRVKAFDPKTNEYIIDTDNLEAGSERVPAAKAKASSVAPIAGG